MSSTQAPLGLLSEFKAALKTPHFLIAFVYFYCLLFAYYLLRPVREEVGILHGVDNLQYLYSATFVVMILIVPLFGLLKNVLSRRVLVMSVYAFFTANLLVFYWLFGADSVSPWLARSFFVWVSVFNMFAVSVFWSLMADIYRPLRATVLFAPLSAAGSLGGITGSWVTASLVEDIGVRNLILLAAVLLCVVAYCAGRLLTLPALDEKHAHRGTSRDERQHSSVVAGVTEVLKSNYLAKIAAVSFLYTVIASLLYFIQANLVSEFLSDSAARTQFFARINLAISCLALLFQLFITSSLVRRFGVGKTFGGTTAIILSSVLLLGIWPALFSIAIAQIVLRGGQFGAMKPCFDMLFSTVTEDQKYKSKNFIDTSLVRAGDLVGAWSFTALKALGMSVGGVTAITAALLCGLALVATNVGRQFDWMRNR